MNGPNCTGPNRTGPKVIVTKPGIKPYVIQLSQSMISRVLNVRTQLFFIFFSLNLNICYIEKPGHFSNKHNYTTNFQYITVEPGFFVTGFSSIRVFRHFFKAPSFFPISTMHFHPVFSSPVFSSIRHIHRCFDPLQQDFRFFVKNYV